MKRMSSVLLVVLLICSLFTGCQNTSDSLPQPNIILGEGSIVHQSSEEQSLPQGSAEVPSAGETPSLPGAESETSGLSSQNSGANASSSSGAASGVSSVASSAASISSQVSSGLSSVSSQTQTQPPTVSGGYAGDEYRAVWFSYLDLAGMLTGKTKSQFAANIGSAFDKISAFGCNVAIVQVRPFGDALYDSDYFPWSYLCTGTEGSSPGFDPLQVMITEAKSRGIEIEAWINPYRVRASGSTKALASSNPAKKWEDAGSDNAVRFGGGLYYNPAREDVRELIIDGVLEIVNGYDIDGIHFDDYFYPSPDDSFDKTAYSEYKNGGGKLSLADWRRENVNILVRDLYAEIKAADSSVRFGISPQANTWNNYNAQYIDVDKWLSNSGYLDYICPQVYFGFKNGSNPYVQTVSNWNSKVKVSGVQLYIGLAAYKIGQSDTWAGSGKNEWADDSEILARQVEAAREYSKYGGFAIFRYASLFSPESSVKNQAEKEKNALADVL